MRESDESDIMPQTFFETFKRLVNFHIVKMCRVQKEAESMKKLAILLQHCYKNHLIQCIIQLPCCSEEVV